jgi:hypothetical protein
MPDVGRVVVGALAALLVKCCAAAITKDKWASDSGRRQEGDIWSCPSCGKLWVHVCDEGGEDGGCAWFPKDDANAS